VGRPRLRWLENTENDLRDLKVNMWRQKENNIEDWESIVKEAKVRI
jgi:hypothetical protein